MVLAKHLDEEVARRNRGKIGAKRDTYRTTARPRRSEREPPRPPATIEKADSHQVRQANLQLKGGCPLLALGFEGLDG